MRLTEAQMKALIGPLNPERVAKRSQSGQTLSYLEAWDVKATLIRVFGFTGFSADVLETEILHREQVENSRKNGMNWKIAARSRVRLTIHDPDGGQGVTYTEDAIAGSTQPDITEALDMAQKSASSDALKRAAIYLGTQFGLSLYDSGQTLDVIRRVFAPGQEWPRPTEKPAAPPKSDDQAMSEAEALVARAVGAAKERGKTVTPVPEG